MAVKLASNVPLIYMAGVVEYKRLSMSLQSLGSALGSGMVLHSVLSTNTKQCKQAFVYLACARTFDLFNVQNARPNPN